MSLEYLFEIEVSKLHWAKDSLAVSTSASHFRATIPLLRLLWDFSFDLHDYEASQYGSKYDTYENGVDLVL